MVMTPNKQNATIKNQGIKWALKQIRSSFICKLITFRIAKYICNHVNTQLKAVKYGGIILLPPILFLPPLLSGREVHGVAYTLSPFSSGSSSLRNSRLGYGIWQPANTLQNHFKKIYIMI